MTRDDEEAIRQHTMQQMDEVFFSENLETVELAEEILNEADAASHGRMEISRQLLGEDSLTFNVEVVTHSAICDLRQRVQVWRDALKERQS